MHNPVCQVQAHEPLLQAEKDCDMLQGDSLGAVCSPSPGFRKFLGLGSLCGLTLSVSTASEVNLFIRLERCCVLDMDLNLFISNSFDQKLLESREHIHVSYCGTYPAQCLAHSRNSANSCWMNEWLS